MAETAHRLQGIGDRLAFAGRRFHAWWEGYGFDAAAERARLLGERQTLAGPPEIAVPELIWGVGRTGPGDAAWTMRHARALGLAARSSVFLFGAERGAALIELKSAARWRATGFARAPDDAANVCSYDEAGAKLSRNGGDGALAFFELYRDADPSAFARFAAEFLKPGAPAAFVDFAIARRGGRLKACFPEQAPGSPRIAADYQKALKDAGFSAADTVDETRIFLPLIARGWSRWKRAYDAASGAPDGFQRAEALCFLRDYAAVWAERHDALKSGCLQVVRIVGRKSG